MSASNKPRPADRASFELLDPRLRAVVEELYRGACGYTVRCTPRRRTVRVEGPPELFGKWRRGSGRSGAPEWNWLHVLPLMGLQVPRAVAWLGRRRRSLLVTEAVAGRPFDAWLVQAAAEGWLVELCEYAVRQVAPAIRRLHEHRIAYRDLYWNHVFVADPRNGDEPTFLDVERAFRPWWRWRRWAVKDLAGLLASLPVPVPPRWPLRFLRAYSGGAPLDPAWIDDIVAKAARIRRHVPRYG